MDVDVEDHDEAGRYTTQDTPPLQLSIPAKSFTTIEHPCIIKNIDKGVVSLGGTVKLSKALNARFKPQQRDPSNDLPNLVSVSLRPGDPLAKRLLATPVNTRNLLLKVTVPKRTGRKRKRGSTGPFVHEEDVGPEQPAASYDYVGAQSVFRRLQDSPACYTVSVAGVVDETHRFRNLPDIQYATSTDPLMTNIRDNLLPLRYNDIQNMSLNTAAGPDLLKSIGPAPNFMQMPVAHNYRFQQNSYVKYAGEDYGEVNLQRSLVFAGYHIIKSSDVSVPHGPKEHLPPISELSPDLQNVIARIQHELEERPIITRHLLYNRIGWRKREKIRQAAVYCGYFFESGPWREALVKWNVDPRTDPLFRKYQTISFLSYKKTGTARHSDNWDRHVKDFSKQDPKTLANEHTFDGINVSHTGNLFQFCDVSEHQVRSILDTPDLRTNCAPTAQGWYHIGTWAKATVILKDKMNRIISKEGPNDALYTRILTWPELWDDQELHAQYRDEYFDRELHQEKLKEHTIMYNVRVAARNPRYAFEKMEGLQTRAPASDRDRSAAQDEDENATIHEDGTGTKEVQVPEDMTEEPDTAQAILNEAEDAGDDADHDDVDGDEDDIDSGQGDDVDEDEVDEDEAAESKDEDSITSDVEATALQSEAAIADDSEADEDEAADSSAVDGEWEPDDEAPPSGGNNETVPAPVKEGPKKPLPFGGLFT